MNFNKFLLAGTMSALIYSGGVIAGEDSRGHGYDSKPEQSMSQGNMSHYSMGSNMA